LKLCTHHNATLSKSVAVQAIQIKFSAGVKLVSSYRVLLIPRPHCSGDATKTVAEDQQPAVIIIDLTELMYECGVMELKVHVLYVSRDAENPDEESWTPYRRRQKRSSASHALQQ